MTYYGGQQLAASFRTVRKNTLQIARDIPEDRYGHVAAEGARTVAQMFVHLAVAPRLFWQAVHESRRSTMEGFDFFAAMREMQADEQRPYTKDQILELLATSGESFAAFLESLSDADLAQVVTGPPGAGAPKSRLESMLAAKEHEMHHRGQLMLIERQLGIVPHLTRQMNDFMEKMKASAAAVS